VLYVFIASLIEIAIVFVVISSIYGLVIILNQYQLIFTQSTAGMIATTVTFIIQIMLIVYIYTLFVFLIPLIAIENRGVLGSLERSVYFVWNHWWRVFSVQFTPWISYLILLFIIRFILRIDIHIYFMEQTPHSFAATLLHLIIFALFIPWVAAILLAQLNDLELRKKMPTII
jgi:hypothetical protein